MRTVDHVVIGEQKSYIKILWFALFERLFLVVSKKKSLSLNIRNIKNTNVDFKIQLIA